jgi:hypothetical protein
MIQLIHKSSLLLIAFGTLLIFAIWSNNNNNAILAYGQEQEPTITTSTSATTPSIKITSPTKGQQVPSGELTITGISSDNASYDCTVYTDWNDLKPMQKVTPTGSAEGQEEGEGGDDYSTWTYTYSEDYHLITEGVNELTSKISCENSPSNNITKSYSVNVTGVGIGQGQQQQQPTSTSEEEEEETISTTSTNNEDDDDDNTPFTLPFTSENPDTEDVESSESQEEEITTNEESNDVNPNDDDEPIIYWDID